MMTPNFIVAPSDWGTSQFNTGVQHEKKAAPHLEEPRGAALDTAGMHSIHFVRSGRERRKHGKCTRWQWRGRRPCAGGEHFAEEDLVAKTSTLSTNRFQLSPLIEGKHFAKIQIHQCIFTFQFS